MSLWEARPPQRWANTPSHLSVSTVSQIESCPRRWSIEHADYTDRGLAHGYPARASLAVLSGRVAHCALERVSRSANASGSSSPEAVVIELRALGGITKVIEGCIRDELAQLSTNPRAASRIEGLEAGLAKKTGELRLLVQHALSLLRFPGGLLEAAPETGAKVRGPLGYGYHAEVELRSSALDWVGYADAVRLAPDECEIVDYKTGLLNPAHAEQLRVYALLWARDPVVNPSGRIADSLMVIYPGGKHRFPAPNLSELAELESGLRARGRAAIDAIRQAPPRAAVGAETCRFCDVKALCSDYWLPASQAIVAVNPTAEYRSLQGVIDREVSPSSATIVLQADPYFPPGTRALLTQRGRRTWQVGETVRLLDVRVTSDNEVDMPIITIGSQSEWFRVP